MINETVLERDCVERRVQARGNVALGKSFSLVALILVTAFFGIFCFSPEIMALPTRFDVSVGIVVFPTLILSLLLVSVLFEICPTRGEYEARLANVEEALE